MASAHHPVQHSRYTHPGPSPTNLHNDFRLPSLKDLNFAYRPPASQDGPSIPAVPGQNDHAAALQDHSTRHAPQPWGRSPTTPVSAPMQPQHQQQQHHHHQQQEHSPPLSTGHEQQAQKVVEYTSKHDNGGYLTPGIPLSAQVAPVVNIGQSPRREETQSQNHQKRTRTVSTASLPRDPRQSHAAYSHPPQYAYPPSQPAAPPTPYPVQHAPSPHEQVHHQPVAVSPTHPPYAGYQQQQQYLQPRTQAAHHQHPQHPHALPPQQHQHPQQQHQVPPHVNPYPPPQAPVPDSWEHPQQHLQHPQQQHQHPQSQHSQHPQHVPHSHPQQPPPPQHSQQHSQHAPLQHQQQPMSFSRTTALVPTGLDGRPTSAYASPELDKASACDNTMQEIVEHCNLLYSFASRYAQLQQTVPQASPTPSELAEMNQRAITVVRLLEEYRRLSFSDIDHGRVETPSSVEDPRSDRAPKRPWEDVSQDAAPEPPDAGGFSDGDKPQSTAEQDMELIRTKRATSAAGGSATAGQPKSKYRKRSRATPPGKCHSCNIRETPEWRRGPDGARTLCNACGLHYAKLQRKRAKADNSDDAPRITIDTLRESARQAEIHDKPPRPSKSRGGQIPVSKSLSPMEQAKQLPQHHQGSFQLVSVMPSEQVMPPTNDTAPPPPWATSAASSGSSGRGYPPDQLQHQSFMRTSQPSNGPSPR